MASSGMAGTTGVSFYVSLTCPQPPSIGLAGFQVRANAHNTSWGPELALYPNTIYYWPKQGIRAAQI